MEPGRHTTSIKNAALSLTLLLLSASGLGYHGTNGTTSAQGSMTLIEALTYYIGPLIVITAFIYPYAVRKLIERYAGDSVVSPDPGDMRKYAITLAGAAALPTTVIAAMTIGSRLDPVSYGSIVGLTGFGAIVANRASIRQHLPL